MESILITGTSGFIGFHLSKFLLKKGFHVIGIDSENDSYDQILKQNRRKILETEKNFTFILSDIINLEVLESIFLQNAIRTVVHLAAEAGVRESLNNPQKYIHSNLVAFSVFLQEVCKQKVNKFIYASSSSVYSWNYQESMTIDSDTDHPKSFYAATKKANEVIAYSYCYNYPIQCIGLRFFSVYGERWRPDMLYFKLLEALYQKKFFYLYGGWLIERDFTYIDDIVDGIYKVIISQNLSQYSLFNFWAHNPISIEKLIQLIEKHTQLNLNIKYEKFHQSDSIRTFADITKSVDELNREPKTEIDTGIQNFIKWYKEYYKF